MDTLLLGLERLLFGANATVETTGEPAAEWLAAELANLYAEHPTRTGDVDVRVVSDRAIEIERKAGMVRRLEVKPSARSWTLAATAVPSKQTPGQVAAILSDP